MTSVSLKTKTRVSTRMPQMQFLTLGLKRCLVYILTKYMINNTQWAIKSHWKKSLMEKTDIFLLPYFSKYRTNINQSLISSVFQFSCCFINFSFSLFAMTFWQIKIIYSIEKATGGRGSRNRLQVWFLLPLNTLKRFFFFFFSQGQMSVF